MKCNCQADICQQVALKGARPDRQLLFGIVAVVCANVSFLTGFKQKKIVDDKNLLEQPGKNFYCVSKLSKYSKVKGGLGLRRKMQSPRQ